MFYCIVLYCIVFTGFSLNVIYFTVLYYKSTVLSVLYYCTVKYYLFLLYYTSLYLYITLYIIVHNSNVLLCTLLYAMVMYCSILYCTECHGLHFIVAYFYYSKVQYIVLCFGIVRCSILYCNVLHFAILSVQYFINILISNVLHPNAL